MRHEPSDSQLLAHDQSFKVKKPGDETARKSRQGGCSEGRFIKYENPYISTNLST